MNTQGCRQQSPPKGRSWSGAGAIGTTGQGIPKGGFRPLHPRCLGKSSWRAPEYCGRQGRWHVLKLRSCLCLASWAWNQVLWGPQRPPSPALAHVLKRQALTFWMPDSRHGQKPSLGGYTEPLANRVLGATKRYVGIPSKCPCSLKTSFMDLREYRGCVRAGTTKCTHTCVHTHALTHMNAHAHKHLYTMHACTCTRHRCAHTHVTCMCTHTHKHVCPHYRNMCTA